MKAKETLHSLHSHASPDGKAQQALLGRRAVAYDTHELSLCDSCAKPFRNVICEQGRIRIHDMMLQGTDFRRPGKMGAGDPLGTQQCLAAAKA